MKNDLGERDNMIAEMKKRLDCEQTDQVIYEKRIKAIESDLSLVREKNQEFMTNNHDFKM